MRNETLVKFSQYLKVERGLSQSTIDSYCLDLTTLMLALNWETLTPDLLATHLFDRGYSIASRRRKWQSVRAYQRFLGQKPWPAIVPKHHRKLPNVMNQDDAKALVTLPTLGQFSDRDTLILALLYGCGLRVFEIANLPPEAICLKQGIIRVIGKGNRARIVPISPWVKSIIMAYSYPEQSRYLICGQFNKPLSRFRIYTIVTNHAKRLGLSTTPHNIRHAFATHLLENGATLSAIQAMLGHQSLATTQLYTLVDKQTIQADYLAAWHNSNTP